MSNLITNYEHDIPNIYISEPVYNDTIINLYKYNLNNDC